MKATGFVQRIDSLGRVAIPVDIRASMGFFEGDTLAIYVEKNENCSRVIFEKYEPQDETSETSRKAAAFVRAQMQEYERVNFEFNGDVTTCYIWYNGTVLVGIAVCSPDDTFDPNIGMAVAMCKAHGWFTDYWLHWTE